MHITADDLVAALRAEGHRITAARRAVCRVLAESHDQHLDAAAIHARVQQDGPAGADQSTVYRTLDALEHAGLVTHTHMGHGPAVYHLAEEADHQHLICDRCGTTVAVAAGDLQAWTEAIRARTGFVVEPSHFALSGRCADCAAD